MQIHKVKLHPFGAFTDKTFEFKKGLNVLFGPNEAGKTTLVNALKLVFFQSTKLYKADEDLKKRWLPLSGGDTFKVTVEFSIGNDLYEIEKVWGGSPATILSLPGGSQITEREKAEEKISHLLSITQGTFDQILFSYQSELTNTLQKLKSEGETTRQLSSILQGSVMNLGGISPEKIREKLNKAITQYFSNWDEDKDYPKNNKGVDNPYLNGNGEIIKAFYKKEELKRGLKNAIDYEKELDQLSSEQKLLQTDLEKAEGFVRQFEGFVQDARQREVLEARIEGLKQKLASINKAMSRWPMAEAERKLKEGERSAAEKELERLQKEEKIALRRKELARAGEDFLRIQKLQGEAEKLNSQLLLLRKVEDEDLKNALVYEKLLTDLNAKVEGQKLQVRISAKKDLKAITTKGNEQSGQISLKSGENLELNAAGLFRFENELIDIQVVSGNERIEEILTRLKKGTTLRSELFSKYNVITLSELETTSKLYQSKENEIKSAQQSLKSALGNRNLDQLAKDAEELKKLPHTEEFEIIKAALNKKNLEIGSLNSECNVLKNEVLEYEKNFGSRENLGKIYIREGAEELKAGEELKKLKELPEGFESASHLIQEFEKFQKAKEKLLERYQELFRRKLMLKNEQPEKTSQELEEELKLAEEIFIEVKKKGKAYKIVLRNLETILAQNHSKAFEPYSKKVSDLFSALTNKKYSRINLSGTLPEAIDVGNYLLTPEHLSKGTKDSLSLALRLAMADYYLKTGNGFLILDDPLVDMDQERQKSAAKVIEGFSEDKQVLLFTCHKHHTELFKNRVDSL